MVIIIIMMIIKDLGEAGALLQPEPLPRVPRPQVCRGAGALLHLCLEYLLPEEVPQPEVGVLAVPST